MWDLPFPKIAMPEEFDAWAAEHPSTVERGPVNVPKLITTRGELRDTFGSIHARGSLGAIEESVHIVLEQELPVGVTVEAAKRELARYWLDRPRGVLARLRWAAKLLLEP
jgi:hypothetical protein